MPNNMKLSTGSMVMGGGLVAALIFTFFPWYSWSYNGGILGSAYSSSVSVGGFNSWGVLFFLVALALAIFYCLRNFLASSVAIPALPIADWLIFLIGAGVMALGALLFLASAGGGVSVSGSGASAGPAFGFYLSLLATIAVGVGAFLTKSEAQPATRPMGSPMAPPPPPPSYGGPQTPPPPPSAPPAPPQQ